jgi:WD40 repeat protein
MFGYEEWDKTCTHACVTYETDVAVKGLSGFAAVEDRTHLLTFAESNVIKVLNTKNGEVTDIRGHKAMVVDTTCTDDGLIVSIGVDGSVNMWNPLAAPTDQWINYMSDSRNNITSLVVSTESDGCVVVTTRDGYVCSWRRDTYLHNCTICVDPKGLYSCAISPLHDVCVLGGYSRIYVHSKDISSMSHITTLGGHNGPVMALAVASLGSTGYMVSAGEDKCITVHRTDMFDLLYSHQNAHTSAIVCLAIHRNNDDGSIDRSPQLLVASASRDSTIRLWRLLPHALDLICQIAGHSGPITSLYIAPALPKLGSRLGLVSAGMDKKMKIWKLYRVLNWHRRKVFMMLLAEYGYIKTITYGIQLTAENDSHSFEKSSIDLQKVNMEVVLRNKGLLRVIMSFL